MRLRGNNQITMFILFMLSIIVLHRTNVVISYTYFGLLLIWLFRKGNNTLILAFLLVILNSPGNLITESLLTTGGRLPFMRLGSGVTIGFSDMYVLLYILYLNRFNKKTKNSYRGVYTSFAVYGIVLILASASIGIYPRIVTLIARLSLYYVLFYSVFSRSLENDKEISELLNCLKILMFIAFVQQISTLVFGRGFWSVIAGTQTIVTDYQDYQETLGGLRIVESGYINLVTTILLLYNISNRRQTNKDIFWLLICYASVLLSATRGWILAYAVMLVITVIINRITRMRLALAIGIIGLIVVIGFGRSSVVFRQFSSSIERVATVTGLAKGDLTAEGTLTRLTTRNDVVMESWRKSPIIGWGFSTQSKSDGHVGNQNIFQVSGVIGFLIIFFGLLVFWEKNYRNSIKYKLRSSVFRSLNIIMLALVIIHSSSTQIFGYDVVFQPYIKIFLVLLPFHLSNLTITESRLNMLQEQKVA